MKRCLLIPLVFALTGTPIWATDLRLSPLDVIAQNGQLNARDGLMAYILMKDGSFSSFPLVESGNSVEGRWKLESSSKGLAVQVEGSFTTVNQGSAKVDARTMRLLIYPGILRDTGHPERDIYQCSVTVEDVKHLDHAVPVPMKPPIPLVK